MKETRQRAWIDLKKMRKNKGLNQFEAAEKLGVSRAYLSAVENGKFTVSIKMMAKIINVFGVER